MRLLATIPLALALLVWSLATIVIDGQASEYRDIAKRLERGGTAEANYFPPVIAELKTEPALDACSRDMVRSATTISLAALDAAVASGDAAAAETALSDARDILKAGLECFPRDGNMWLRLAMVEYATTKAVEPAAKMVALSAEFAPLEGWILKQRLAFTSRLAEIDQDSVSQVLRADIDRFARHGRIADVVNVFAKGDPQARSLMMASFGGLPEQRRDAIVAGINAQ
jgi:hypothetical protein